MKLSFFSWLRNRVREAVLGEISDAVAMLDEPEPDGVSAVQLLRARLALPPTGQGDCPVTTPATQTAAHTPGPWSCEPKGKHCEINAPTFFILARVYAPNDRYAEGEANARLIGTAPLLLEALQRIIQSWDDSKGEAYGEAYGEDIRAVRQVVAAATGSPLPDEPPRR